MNHRKKIKIKIFHPKKLWLFLAMIALTVGVAVGEHQADTEISPLMALKISQNFQASSFSQIDTTKMGVMRAQYRVSFLASDSVNPLDEPAKEGVKTVCFAEENVEEIIYSAKTTEVKITENIQPGNKFLVEIYVENTGNVTWYGMGSGCLNKTVVNLGTIKETDRASEFFAEGATTGWVGNNRIKMLEDTVRPGETATFVFTATAPEQEAVYREWFGLVAEHVAWLSDFEVPVDIQIGNVTEEDLNTLEFIKSISTNTAALIGDRWVDINLSTQKLSLMIGETPAYITTISSGASKTPTPTGTWKILNKQELRVGGEWPHYRMPYFQQFTQWGHGLHALPYLESDNGVFWSEALNHIGIPVSHGCVRMLPDDAITVYDFSDVGTSIYIHR